MGPARTGDIPAPNMLASKKFRLILDDPRPARVNMAVDETLLESVGETGLPVVRLYSFTPSALSVGRFQTTRGVFDLDGLRRDEIDFVRRPSGGQAVLHSDELTYCVVVAKEHPKPFGKREAYDLVVPLILGALERLGVENASAAPGDSRRAIGEPADPDCFAQMGEYEIDSQARRKLVGSAQMVSRKAVLQHGSIPLRAANRSISDYFVPVRRHSTMASSIAEETGVDVDFLTARNSFEQSIRERLTVVEGVLDPAELARSRELTRLRYGNEEWNVRL